MKTGSIMKRVAAATAALALAACAPVPMHFYVADEAAGSLVYSTCSFNKHVPLAVSLEREGVRAIVKLVEQDTRGFVEVRFDVPPGKTLVFRDHVVRIDRRDSRPVLEASIPNVSKVDTPHINSYSELPGVRKLMLPVGTPLEGGRIVMGPMSSDRHYWIAARVDAEAADDVWVTLPSITVNGAPADLAEIHFKRRLLVAVATINC